MNPTNGSCTEWQVKVMINEAIKEYDGRQEQRHKENTERLDRNASTMNALKDSITDEFTAVRQALALEKSALAAQQGAEKYKQWLFPSLLTVGLVIIGIIDLFKR